MIKVKNNIASRTPLPSFLLGLQPVSLANLSWTDPALGVSDCAWWPEDDQSPELAEYERYGAETLKVDSVRKVVVVSRVVAPWSAEEIEVDVKSRVPQVVPKLNARLVLIEAGYWSDVVAFATEQGEVALAYLEDAQTIRRDNPLVNAWAESRGRTGELDGLFTAAGALVV